MSECGSLSNKECVSTLCVVLVYFSHRTSDLILLHIASAAQFAKFKAREMDRFKNKAYEPADYTFAAYEQRVFRSFASQEECEAYLTFARDAQNAGYPGFIRMHLWQGDGKYDWRVGGKISRADAAHALTAAQRAERILVARRTRYIRVRVAPDDLPPLDHGPIPPQVNTTNLPLNWRYAETIYRRNPGDPNDRMTTTVSLHLGEDNAGALRDVSQKCPGLRSLLTTCVACGHQDSGY